MASEFIDVDLLRARDSRAWDDLYVSTCRRTYRVLFHVTGAKESILEELNQEVWLSAIESVDRFDAARGTAQDWILGIARLKGLTFLRKHYRRKVAFVGSNDDLPTQPLARTEPSEIKDKVAMLRATIECLPENWQYVLRQKYDEGMSVKEIADLTGGTPKAVESILSRARKRLRQMYRETLHPRRKP